MKDFESRGDEFGVKFEGPSHGSVQEPVGGFPLKAKRQEEKAVIPHGFWGRFISETEKHLSLSTVGDTKHFTEIESVYYDSKELDFFKHHFHSVGVRYKVRLRRYAPDGDWNHVSASYLEVKKKEKKISSKYRIQVSSRVIKDINHHLPIYINDELVALNSKMSRSDLDEAVHLFNGLQLQYRIMPILTSTYRRVAYEDANTRVTFDTDLKHKLLYSKLPVVIQSIDSTEVKEKGSEMLVRYSGQKSFVFEVKSVGGTLPDWISKLLNEAKMSPTSFSKYCWNTMAIFSPNLVGLKKPTEKVS